MVGSCVPPPPLQLLVDLSEYVSLTSPASAASVSAKAQRQPPDPPPVSTRAPAAELVSVHADRTDGAVRTRRRLPCLITNRGHVVVSFLVLVLGPSGLRLTEDHSKVTADDSN